jgi:hypothetical protein
MAGSLLNLDHGPDIAYVSVFRALSVRLESGQITSREAAERVCAALSSRKTRRLVGTVGICRQGDVRRVAWSQGSVGGLFAWISCMRLPSEGGHVQVHKTSTEGSMAPTFAPSLPMPWRPPWRRGACRALLHSSSRGPDAHSYDEGRGLAAAGPSMSTLACISCMMLGREARHVKLHKTSTEGSTALTACVLAAGRARKSPGLARRLHHDPSKANHAEEVRTEKRWARGNTGRLACQGKTRPEQHGGTGPGMSSPQHQ